MPIDYTSFSFIELDNHQKFAQAEITHTLLTYLARYREFSSSENMRRVVSLLHRQAVKAKAEGLFFKVRVARLFDLRLCCGITQSSFFGFIYVGVDFGPLQDNPCRSEVVATRPTLQGPHKSN